MGGGVAAVNEIVALLRVAENVVVLSRKSTPVPSIFGGESVGIPQWLCPDEVTMPLPAWSRQYVGAQARVIGLVRKIQRLRPTILVVQDPAGHRRAELYRSWAGIPRIMTVHGSPDQFSGRYHDGQTSLDRMLKEMESYDEYVLPSALVAEKWRELGNLHKKRFHVIHNCADEAMAEDVVRFGDRAAYRKALDIPPDQFVAVCVASIQHRKGQDVLVSQLNAIVDAVPSFHLYLVGPVIWGWGGREILRVIEAHSLRNRIHVVGNVSARRAMEICRAADIAVLPSREEVFGIVNVEAQLLGTPVIAADVDGLPEIVEDGVNGLLFAHQHPGTLAAAVARMFRDVAFRKECAERGKQIYERKFSQRLYLRRWSQLIREVLS
ncbi:MAG TPA: glycosyltransferase family 4 protein [Kiritimatiellia bacterium]|nr:glycosyltransferase family 4 protein [Kiritimatiellia bacterium]